MFKKILLCICLISSFSLAESYGSADKKTAVGVWLQGGNSGEHAGIDIELRQNEINTLDIYASFKFKKHHNSAGAYVGYYWNNYDIINVAPNVGRMGLYLGPAVGFGWWGDYGTDGLAFRAGIVGGWEWEFPQVVPIEVYVELNPVGEFHYLMYDHDDNDTDWEIPDLYLRIGLRFWF